MFGDSDTLKNTFGHAEISRNTRFMPSAKSRRSSGLRFAAASWPGGAGRASNQMSRSRGRIGRAAAAAALLRTRGRSVEPAGARTRAVRPIGAEGSASGQRRARQTRRARTRGISATKTRHTGPTRVLPSATTARRREWYGERNVRTPGPAMRGRRPVGHAPSRQGDTRTQPAENQPNNALTKAAHEPNKQGTAAISRGPLQ